MESARRRRKLQLQLVLCLVAVVEVVAGIPPRCSVSEGEEKLLCGSSGITRTACEELSCCFDGQLCFYGKSVTVHCTKDGQFVVVAARDVTKPRLDLSSISLLEGSDGPCVPVGTTEAYIIYQFHVNDCGSRMQMDEGTVVYENVMSASVDVIGGPAGSVTRDSIYQLIIQCRYSGDEFVPLEASVLNLPPPLPAKARGPLNVELRLARDWTYGSYYEEEDYPVTKFLQRPVYVEVHILRKRDPNLVLTLQECWATSHPNPNSLPQWNLLARGCPYQNDICLTRFIPVGGASAPANPTHYKRFMIYMFTFVNKASLRHMKEKVFIHCSTAVCSPSPSNTCMQSCHRQRRDVGAVRIPSPEDTDLVTSGEVILTFPWAKDSKGSPSEKPDQQTEQKDQQTEQKDQQTEQKDQQTEQKDQQTEQKDQQTEQKDQQTEQKDQQTEQTDQQTDHSVV